MLVVFYRRLGNKRHNIEPLREYMTSSKNRKYITYRNAVREGLATATGNMQTNFVKFGRVVVEQCKGHTKRQQTDRQTDRQTDKHTYSSQYFAPLPGAKLQVDDLQCRVAYWWIYRAILRAWLQWKYDCTAAASVMRFIERLIITGIDSASVSLRATNPQLSSHEYG